MAVYLVSFLCGAFHLLMQQAQGTVTFYTTHAARRAAPRMLLIPHDPGCAATGPCPGHQDYCGANVQLECALGVSLCALALFADVSRICLHPWLRALARFSSYNSGTQLDRNVSGRSRPVTTVGHMVSLSSTMLQTRNRSTT